MDYDLIIAGRQAIDGDTHELAKELGFDAGFGMNTYADDVASFVVQEMVKRGMK